MKKRMNLRNKKELISLMLIEGNCRHFFILVHTHVLHLMLGVPMALPCQMGYSQIIIKKKKVSYDFAMRGKEVWTRYGLSGHYDILVLLLFSHSVVDLLGIIVA